VNREQPGEPEPDLLAARALASLSPSQHASLQRLLIAGKDPINPPAPPSLRHT
jgi:hypothetical protein